MSSISKKIGSKIAELRKKQKMTQAVLAEKAKISPDFLSRIERGINSASTSRLNSIAKALGFPLKELLDFEEKNTHEKEMQAIVYLLRRRKIKELKKVQRLLEVLFDE